jgi:hypothetical protein
LKSHDWLAYRLGAVLSSKTFETLASVVGERRASVDASRAIHARFVILARVEETALRPAHALIALTSRGKQKK